MREPISLLSSVRLQYWLVQPTCNAAYTCMAVRPLPPATSSGPCLLHGADSWPDIYLVQCAGSGQHSDATQSGRMHACMHGELQVLLLLTPCDTGLE